MAIRLKKVTAQDLVEGFATVGKAAHKIAPMVRQYIGNKTGGALKAAQKEVYDGIRAKAGENSRGGLVSAAKLPDEIAAMYAAARQAFRRAVQKRDAKSRGPIVKLTSAQKAYNRAFDARAELQRAEDCPAELLAAFDAAMATAIRLGAVAKEEK